jgi:hypothetical protein
MAIGVIIIVTGYATRDTIAIIIESLHLFTIYGTDLRFADNSSVIF